MDRTAVQPAVPENYKWNVLGVIMIGTIMSTLDSSIVNVSIPAIMSDFSAGLDDIEWVMTGYMLAFAVLMPLTAWLKEKIGYKIIYITALFVFTFGSLLCGMAWNLPSLIAARVIQALGGGAIMPIGMAMMADVFPPKERGRAMGMWSLAIIIGPALGPTLGGYLTETFGWRSIFLVNIPIGAIGMVLSQRLLMADQPHGNTHKPFDMWGFVFLSVFLVSLLLGLSKGEKEGWTSAYILTCAGTSLVTLIGFLLVENNVDHGIIDLQIFSSPVFTACAIVSVARSIILFGGIFLLPLFLQQQMGFSETMSGLIMMPGALAIAVVSPFVGRLSDKVGPRWPVLFGLILLLVFQIMYGYVDFNWSVLKIINPTIIRGVGFAFIMAPMTTAAINSVPRNKAGAASSVISLIQQVGGSLGIALLGTVLSNRAIFHIGSIGEEIKSNTPAFVSRMGRLIQHAHNLGYSYADSSMAARGLIMKHAVSSGMVMAFQDAFIVGGVIVAITLPLAFLLPKDPYHHESHEGRAKEDDKAALAIAE
jgi:DHA2 family multidrug resistance protein